MTNESSCKRGELTRYDKNRIVELDFRHRFEAARANVASNAAAILIDSSPLDIRPELALRLLLRETHIVAAHRPLATYFTFRHNFTLPDARLSGVQTKGDRSAARIFDSIKNDPEL